MIDIGLLALLIAVLCALAAIGCFVAEVIDRLFFAPRRERLVRTAPAPTVRIAPMAHPFTGPDRRS